MMKRAFHLFLGLLLLCAPAPAQPLAVSVDEAVQRALAANPELREAMERRRADLHDAEATRTGIYPTFSASANFQHQGKLPTMTMNGATYSYGAEDGFDITGRVDQLLFDAGRTDADIKKASAAVQASFYTLKAIENAVRARTRERCYEVMRAKALLRASAEAVKAALAHRQDAEARVRAGVAAGVEVIRAEVRVQQTALTQVNRDNQVKLALANLATIMGLATESEIDITGSLPDSGGVTANAEAEVTALSKRPDVLAMRAAAQANRLDVLTKASAWYPAFRIFGDWSYQDDETTSGDDDWRVGISGTWEFFNWGRTGNQVRAAQSRARAASEKVKVLEDQVKIEVRQAQLAATSAREAMRLAESQIRSAAEDLRISTLRFNEGVGTGTEAIDAEKDLAEAQAARINAQADWAVAQARLWLATGGDNGLPAFK